MKKVCIKKLDNHQLLYNEDEFIAIMKTFVSIGEN